MDTTYTQNSDLKSAREQTTMYLGGKSPVNMTTFVASSDNNLYKKKISLSPAGIQCFREVITNAGDQCILNNGGVIYIQTDGEEISVENTKSFIPIGKNKTLDGRELWTPQFIFGEFKTSSNYNKTKKTPTGGKYGFGVKLVNAFCKKFSVETNDIKNKKLYYQVWEDCMSKVNPPIIEDSQDDDAFVCVKLQLNWEDFNMNSEHMQTYYDMCYTLSLYLSAYLPNDVYYNDKKIPIKTCHDLCKSILRPLTPNPDKIYDIKIKNKEGLVWNLSIGIKPGGSNMEVLSIINGISVSAGTHIEYFKDRILTYIKDKYLALAKKASGKKDKVRFLSNRILQYLCIVHIGQMIQPDFSGQRKDSLDAPEDVLNEYQIPDIFIEQIWGGIKEHVEYDLEIKNIKKTRKVVKAKKYVPADKLGPNSWLFLGEGDSAIATIKAIINNKHSPISNNTHGTFSTGGVIPNIRKEMRIIKHPKTGKKMIKLKTKILESERIQSLLGILGIDVSSPPETTYGLPYRGIIIGTDQDEDGKGNIRSLIVSLFYTICPNLVKDGFIKFLVTPVIRAYPNRIGVVQEFMSEQAFNTWSETVNVDNYEIIYYKGLASHGNEEIEQMSKNYHNMEIKYIEGKHSELLCEIYFGEDADLRKEILVHPPIGNEEDFYNNGTITIDDHFNTDTRAFQQYNIIRHIPGIDGFTPSSRKIVTGTYRKWKNSNKRCKVLELSGYVMGNMGYHHGDASLNGTIIRNNQSFIGARNFPFLKALSGFGTRVDGGSGAGSPRYIYTIINNPLVKTLYPEPDWWILPYTFVDGKRFEPSYLSPIVPIGILENYTSPATGWQTCIWARDYFDISNYLKECIKEGDLVDRDHDFKVCDWNLDHDLQTINKTEVSIGKYTRYGDMINITELPLRMWNTTLIEGPKKKKKTPAVVKKSSFAIPKYGCLNENPYITKIKDNSNNNNIDIKVYFKPGTLDTIISEYANDKYDPIIRYLNLKQSLKHNLNYIKEGIVTHYDRYLDVFDDWFYIRKDLYSKRIDRQTIILKLKILMFENKIRFATRSYKINNIKTQDQIKILTENKYQMINKTLLDNPEYTDIDKIEDEILRGKKISYKYLLTMNSLDTSDENIEKMETTLQKLKDQLDALDIPNEKFKGASIWLKEIQDLDTIVTKYRNDPRGWKAWDKKSKWN